VTSHAWTNFAARAFNTPVSSGTPNTVHPGTWTALWIGAVLTGIGATLALDIKGIATAIHKNNTEFTPWGRRLQTSTWPNPARFVGWFFLILGAILLSLTIIAGAVYLIRHL
jgi:hypothetical protein